MGVTGSEGMRAAAARLREADKPIRAELAKSMRAAAKPITAAIQDEVRKAPSKSGASAAAVERAGHALNRGTKPGKALSARQVKSRFKRASKLSSLRENIAAAVGSTVSTGAAGVGITFRARSSVMPPGQRKLIKRWNLSSGWKHPVYGNRRLWVKQYGRPYFDKTIHEHKDEVRAAVEAAMTAAAEQITHGGATP